MLETKKHMVLHVLRLLLFVSRQASMLETKKHMVLHVLRLLLFVARQASMLETKNTWYSMCYVCFYLFLGKLAC